MAQLPRELIRLIFELLNPRERLNCSLTCRSWAEEASQAPLLEEIWLIIRGVEKEYVIPALLKSERQYRNLRIIGADMTTDFPILWPKLGPHIRHLQLIECNLATDDLRFILRCCPELELLAIRGSSEGCASYAKLKPSENVDDAGVFESFPKVRILELEFAVTGEILDHFLKIMPNAESLLMASQTEDDEPNIPNLTPPLLEAGRMFTRLDITSMNLSSKNLINLVEMYSDSLQDLRVNCSSFSNDAYAALGDCFKLQHLSLEEAYFIENSHVEKICRSSPALATFNISRCDRLTDEGFEHIKSLRKLENLSVYGCRRFTINSLNDLERIATTLQLLDLQGTSYGSKCIAKILCLKNLRTLILDCLMYPQGFEFICDNLKLLERIHFGSCEMLQDADGVRFAQFEHLKSLCIKGGDQFSNIFFGEGMQAQEMDSLRLGTSSLTDHGLAGIACHQSRLIVLELSNCKRITDAGLATVLQPQRRLQLLILKSCTSLTAESLGSIENLCPGLERLVLHECPISISDVQQFKEQRPFVYVDYIPVLRFEDTPYPY